MSWVQVRGSVPGESMLNRFLVLTRSKRSLIILLRHRFSSQSSGSNKDFKPSVKRSRLPVLLKPPNQPSTSTSTSCSLSTDLFTPSSSSSFRPFLALFLSSLTSLLRYSFVFSKPPRSKRQRSRPNPAVQRPPSSLHLLETSSSSRGHDQLRFPCCCEGERGGECEGGGEEVGGCEERVGGVWVDEFEWGGGGGGTEGGV